MLGRIIADVIGTCEILALFSGVSEQQLKITKAIQYA